MRYIGDMGRQDYDDTFALFAEFVLIRRDSLLWERICEIVRDFYFRRAA